MIVPSLRISEQRSFGGAVSSASAGSRLPASSGVSDSTTTGRRISATKTVGISYATRRISPTAAAAAAASTNAAAAANASSRHLRGAAAERKFHRQRND